MKIAYSKEAVKQLDNLRLSDTQTWKRVSQKIIWITEWKVFKEKLKWYKDYYKARVGKYRIVYTYEKNILIIVITIMKRGKVYKKKLADSI